ncbi:hypothetical protein HY312_01620 [Candidatus Saccharibacteria bacterium]|nr:hypothetical protein [Candidatus Saccharibacteria bacterium]
MGANKRVVSTVVGGISSLVSVIASPILASAAFSNANTTINATVAATISISSGPTVAIAVTPTAGGSLSSSSDSVYVSTNNTAGYTLTLADSDATTNLTSGGNTIGAHAGTQASPTVLATNKWGYRVVNIGGFGATAYSGESNVTSSTSTWAGMPATGAANTIKTTAATANLDLTTVWYGVRATSSQPAGVYTDTVTYTATTN